MCLEVQFPPTIPVHSSVIIASVYFAVGKWQLFRNFHCVADGKFKYFVDNWAKMIIFSFTSDQCPRSEGATLP